MPTYIATVSWTTRLDVRVKASNPGVARMLIDDESPEVEEVQETIGDPEIVPGSLREEVVP